jgi:hypothetical protein
VTCTEEWQKEVVISVIENFQCNEVCTDPDDENIINESIEKVIRKFTKVIGVTSKK